MSRLMFIATSRRRSPSTVKSRSINSRIRSEEHTSELQSLMRISYAVFCLKKKKKDNHKKQYVQLHTKNKKSHHKETNTTTNQIQHTRHNYQNKEKQHNSITNHNQ